MIGILDHDGAFADLVAVPERNLHAVPDVVDTDVAVFTEPLAAACQIPAQMPIGRDDRVVVLGDGRLGNLCAQVLAEPHAITSLVVGKHPGKLAAARCTRDRDAGAGRPAGTRRGRHRRRLHRIGERIADGARTGAAARDDRAEDHGRRHADASLAPVVVDEVTIVGSRCGPFDRALEALAAGLIDVRTLIADRFDLRTACGRCSARGNRVCSKCCSRPRGPAGSRGRRRRRQSRAGCRVPAAV